MSDLGELLADEAVRRRPVTTPPFDTVLQRARRRRLSQGAGATLAAAAVVGVALAVVMLVSGRPQPVAAPVPPPLATFSVPGLQFEYPAEWSSYEYEAPHSYISAVAILSTDFVPDPCATTSDATGVTFVCGGPGANLTSGGVLVTWTSYSGPPGFHGQRFFDAASGDPLTVSGRPAKSALEPATGGCALSGGSVDRRVTILGTGDRPPVIVMSACLAEPTAHAESQVQAMLDSVRFA